MGVPMPENDGWLRNRGLRIIGGGGRIELDWPELSSYPATGWCGSEPTSTRSSPDTHRRPEHGRIRRESRLVMGVLKDHKFWIGVVVGWLLLTFVPQINFLASATKKAPGQ